MTCADSRRGRPARHPYLSVHPGEGGRRVVLDRRRGADRDAAVGHVPAEAPVLLAHGHFDRFRDRRRFDLATDRGGDLLRAGRVVEVDLAEPLSQLLGQAGASAKLPEGGRADDEAGRHCDPDGAELTEVGALAAGECQSILPQVAEPADRVLADGGGSGEVARMRPCRGCHPPPNVGARAGRGIGGNPQQACGAAPIRAAADPGTVAA